MPEGRIEHIPDDGAAARLSKPGFAEPDLYCTTAQSSYTSGDAAQLQIPLLLKTIS